MNARKTALAALAAIPGASALLLAAGLLAGVSSTPAHAQKAPQYSFYVVGAHDLDANQATQLGQRMELVPAVQSTRSSFVAEPPDPCITFSDANGNVRMIYYKETGQIKLFPDLTQTFSQLPAVQDSIGQAMGFLQKNDLVPAVQRTDGSLQVSEVITTANQQWQSGMNVTGAPSGGPVTQPTDVMQTVNFYLQVDGLRVMGPDYMESVDITSNGVVGFSHEFHALRRLDTPVRMITQDDATNEFTKEFAPTLTGLQQGDPGITYQIMNTDLVYFQQGRLLQPAYRFQLQISSPSGDPIMQAWFVPAASNSPVGIVNMPVPTFGAQPVTTTPIGGGGIGNLPSALRALPAPQPAAPARLASAARAPASAASKPANAKRVVYDPLDFAVYEVRDDNRFLDGANGFIANLQFSNLIANGFEGKGYPQTVLSQYYWDEPWMWENDPADGVPDNSPWFVGANNLVLYEGHGEPWEVTTYSNCCDPIYYTTIPGYGAYHGGEITNYVLWHTCDSIPAPGDPYAGNYAAPAGPFDIWFNIFQGMRGTYGARTEVWIYDGVEPAFASAAGLGVPNLSNWLNAEANNSQGHSTDTDYGCCVIIAGHENDTIYNTGALAPPGTLTMYWQHS